MTQRIQTKLIQTEPVAGFSPEVQRAFAAIGQHIDFLLASTDSPYIHKGYNGSDSWMLDPASDGKVIIKTFPWDQRFRKELDLPAGSAEGFGVLVRDEFLRPSDMRSLWNAFGKAYRPSPSFPLYAVRPQDKKHFQLLLWRLGPDCSVFALPGVVLEEIDARLALRSYSGRMIALRAEGDSPKPEGAAEADPGVLAALRAMIQRTQSDANESIS